MGHWKHLDDPPKQVFDPSNNIKKILDDNRYVTRFDPYGPIKFDPYEGLLPFILNSPHQYNVGYLSENPKITVQMYDNLIQQAEYQINMLKAHVESLHKMKESLNESYQE